MLALARIIPTRYWTQRCNGCTNTDPHDAHLTAIGRLIFAVRKGNS